MSIMEVDINDEDVEAVVKRLKNKKAPGPDGSKNEMYKKLGQEYNYFECSNRMLNKLV